MPKPLKNVTLEDVTLYPWENEITGTVAGGIWDKRLPRIFRHYRRSIPCDQQPSEKIQNKQAEYYPGTYIYGGLYTPHFGHSVAEHFHRLWAVERFGDDHPPVLFMGRVGESWITPFFKEAMTYFGVRNYEVHFDLIRVEKLIVPQQGKGLNQSSLPGYDEILAHFAKKNHVLNQQGFPESLVVARSHLKDRRLIGESVFEEALKAEGYCSFRPEEHPLLLQLQTLANAKQVVLAAGSGCHLYDLLPKTEARAFVYGGKSGRRIPAASVKNKVNYLHFYDEITDVLFPSEDRHRYTGNKALLYVPLSILTAALKNTGFMKRTLQDLNDQVLAREVYHSFKLGHDIEIDQSQDKDSLIANLVRANFISYQRKPLDKGHLNEVSKTTRLWRRVKKTIKRYVT